MGGFIANSFIPFLMTLNFRVISPAISIAPQKLISPSPSTENGIDAEAKLKDNLVTYEKSEDRRR